MIAATRARMFIALLALTPAAPAVAADGDQPADIKADIETFRAEKVAEVKGAIREVEELIAETERQVEALNAQLDGAREGLGRLEAIRDALEGRPAPAAPAADQASMVSPGAPSNSTPYLISAPFVGDDVRYFPPDFDFPMETAGADPLVRTAYAAVPDGPPATIRVHAADGHLVVEHDGYGRGGAVTCTTLEIAAQSPEQAHAVAGAVRADGSPIVCWPFLNVGVGRAEPEPAAAADPATAERLAAVEVKLDRLIAGLESLGAPLPAEAPAPAPPATISAEAIPAAPAVPR